MQALEDLATRYDDSVRNSEGKVVQFKYGDDGLDPACLEGESSPVAFPRSWTHAKVRPPCLPFASPVGAPADLLCTRVSSLQGIAKKGGRSLLPWEVKDILNKALDSVDYTRDCEPAYLNSVEDFVTEHVVKPMVRTRTKYGLYPADEYEEETEGIDLDIGADRASPLPSERALPRVLCHPTLIAAHIPRSPALQPTRASPSRTSARSPTTTSTSSSTSATSATCAPRSSLDRPSAPSAPSRSESPEPRWCASSRVAVPLGRSSR